MATTKPLVGLKKTEHWIKSLQRYLQESRQEAKKITWPDRRYVAVATGVVLVIVCFITLLIMGIDFVFSRVFNLIFQAPVS